jgi:hypothetical protein
MTIINRREALTGAGALVVSMTLPGVAARAATLGARLPLKPEQLATYISINQDGSAVGWIGKVDMARAPRSAGPSWWRRSSISPPSG